MEVQRKRQIMMAVAIGLLVIAGLVLYSHQSQSASGRGLNQPVTFKCIDPQCGTVKASSLQWASEHWNATEEWPVVPGAPCPKCGKNTLATALTCPNDGTIFFQERVPAAVLAPKGTDAYKAIAGQPHGKCPKCGWSSKPPAPSGS